MRTHEFKVMQLLYSIPRSIPFLLEISSCIIFTAGLEVLSISDSNHVIYLFPTWLCSSFQLRFIDVSEQESF